MRCWVLFVIACGHASPPPPHNDQPQPAVKDTRTPLEQRRDKACEIVAKRVTQCAVDDAKKDLAAGKVTQANFDKDTAPAVVAKNAEKYAEKCKAKDDYSSRQIRVLEKCPEYETECEPFLKCLENLTPQH
jgi:hypothetical protein